MITATSQYPPRNGNSEIPIGPLDPTARNPYATEMVNPANKCANCWNRNGLTLKFMLNETFKVYFVSMNIKEFKHALVFNYDELNYKISNFL